ncbi:hypothetical protein [Arenimonas sp.]|uniref:hypothetical protein n=1 Tax=Arenimonas sp. TaxID=1872635 RepID=UPI0039E2967A
MKRTTILLGAGLCFVFAAPMFASPESAPVASRPALAKECQWKPFEDAGLGVSLLVQDCPQPNAHYVFSAKGNRLEQHRPADDNTFGGPLVLEMFRKKKGETIEQAIATRFIAKLPAEAKASCKVEALARPGFGKDRLAFTLVPTGAYKAKIDKELSEEPRDFGCGAYGKDQATTYFEYHPAESKTRFAFVVYGMDEPLFDEQSLKFAAD